MQFRLRTLLIILSLGPPALGFATLMASDRHPVQAALIMGWSVAFCGTLTRRNWAAAEWLTLVAIAFCVAALCLPTEPCYWGGCRE